MPGQSSQDLMAQAVDLFAQRVNEYSTGIANRLGQPMSGSQLNKDQVLERWNYTPLGDAQVADAHYHQLVAQGTPPGQALDAVYPFRKTLFSGPDLRSQIDTANQIAGWDAAAKGTQVPEPDPHALPLLHIAQSMAPQPPPTAVPPMPMPASMPGGMSPAGIAPGGAPPLPMTGLGQPMPQVAPVAQPPAGLT